MSSPVLSLIQEAIDVRLMDVKNIADMIYQYIQYDYLSGDTYNVSLSFGHRGENKIFIADGKFLLVKAEPFNTPLKDIENGGIRINHINCVRKEQHSYDAVLEWYEKMTSNQVEFTPFVILEHCKYREVFIDLKTKDDIQYAFDKLIALWQIEMQI
jgi:hypothetical protein